MITQAFNHRRTAAITHTKALSGPASSKEPATCRAVKARVADNLVGRPLIFRIGRRTDDDFTAVHTLADIIICLAKKLHAYTRSQKGA